MLSPYSIIVDKLTERFRVSSDRPPTLKERLSTFRQSHFRMFEALRDVSMTVRHGESVGIIGHNGSGKSTLLKCMAGILRADEG
ncbi:MAG: ATP-binding cassette domain-containing protein, partial [Pseudonocardiaceae bacterium]